MKAGSTLRGSPSIFIMTERKDENSRASYRNLYAVDARHPRVYRKDSHGLE